MRRMSAKSWNWYSEFWINLMRLNPIRLFRPIAGGALALLCALSGCKPRGNQAAAPPPPPPLVKVENAVAQNVPVYLDEIGKCAARESVTISPQIAGRLMNIHFTDGADVKKGDKLFTIDPRPFQAALDQANAGLAQDQAALDFARSELKRDEELLATKAIAKSDYDLKKNAVAVGIARVNADRATGEMATLNLEYCFIKSEIDGRAGQRLVDTGNVVKANETALLVIQRLDPIYADFTITERDLPAVQREMKNGTLKTFVTRPDDSDGPREGELTFLDNAVQDGTGTVKLRATLPNKDHHFWPGQYVNIRLVLSVKKNAVLVPSVATQLGQKGRYVYVIDPDLTAKLRPVVLGQGQGDMVVVEEGVAAGERVVTIGQIGIMPDKPVRLAPPSTTQSTPSTAGAEAGADK